MRKARVERETGLYPLADQVAQVEITAACSADMVRAIDRADLKPARFRVKGGKWQRV